MDSNKEIAQQEREIIQTDLRLALSYYIDFSKAQWLSIDENRSYPYFKEVDFHFKRFVVSTKTIKDIEENG